MAELEVQVEERIERGGYCLKLGIMISMHAEGVTHFNAPLQRVKKKDSV